jgi:hypothetical protein
LAGIAGPVEACGIPSGKKIDIAIVQDGYFSDFGKIQSAGSQTAVQHIEDKTDAGKCIFAAVK